MSGAHTPGPWSVFPHWCKDDDESVHAQTWVIGPGQYSTIAEVRPGSDKFDSQNDANANLIATAPDLLEALADVMGILGRAESNASGNPEFDYIGPRVAAARAALAKARGQ